MVQIHSLKTETKFKKTEIGDIPVDWQIVKVKDTCENSEYGYTASATQEAIGPKFLRISDIQDGEVNWKKVPYCMCPDYLKKKYLLQNGDILFARTGATTGKSYIIKNCPEAIFASYLIRIRTRHILDPFFLYQVFNSFIYWKQVKQQMRGSAQGGVSASSLSKIVIPLPPYIEQKKISEILSTVDEAIEKKKGIIEKTKELKKGLMQELLTRGIGHSKFRKTEIGEIPEEWAVVRVKDLCKRPEYGFTASATDEPFGPKFLRITDIQDGNVDWETVPYCKCPDSLIENYILKSGDILFARTGATTGKSFMIRTCPKAIFASYLIRITAGERIIPDFLYQVFNSFIYWKQINQQIRGSAQGGVNASSLARIKVPLPSKSEQNTIINILSSIDNEIDNNILYLKKNENIKIGLMQVLLSGNLRVSI